MLIGVDIGGTKIAVAAVAPDGRVLDRAIAPTPAHAGPEAILDSITTLVSSMPPGTAIGVGAPGVVSPHGVILSATDLLAGWTGTDVKSELERRLGLPTTVDNDVRAAALGEAVHGAGRSAEIVLVISVGTGVGGGLIRSGHVDTGASGLAGHFGHIYVDSSDRTQCSCGRTGHLEAAAAGPSIVRKAQAAGLDTTDLQEVDVLARSGDSTARRVLGDAAVILGRSLGGLVNALDPALVVLSGGVAECGEDFWTPLRTAFRDEILPPAASTVDLIRATLGPEAGVVGAATLCVE